MEAYIAVSRFREPRFCLSRFCQVTNNVTLAFVLLALAQLSVVSGLRHMCTLFYVLCTKRWTMQEG